MSRQTKLKCARVLMMLRTSLEEESGGYGTFAQVSEKAWEKMARAAADETTPVNEVQVVWRNKDVTDKKRKFQIVETPKQVAMPKVVDGRLLANSSRDGTKYCPLFQQGICKENEKVKRNDRTSECPLGRHSCAAIFRSGRTCHGAHPGGECREERCAKPSDEGGQSARQACGEPRRAQEAAESKGEPNPLRNPGGAASGSGPRRTTM